MKRFWKVVRWSLIVVVILFGLLVASLYYWNVVRCHTKLLSNVPGPDDITASVIQEVCYSADIYIELKNKSSGKKKVVFDYWPLGDEITLKWIDKNHLDVTIPKLGEAGPETTEWNGIQITYHIGDAGYHK